MKNRLNFFLFLSFIRKQWQIRVLLIETRRLSYNMNRKKILKIFRLSTHRGDPSLFRISSYCNFFPRRLPQKIFTYSYSARREDSNGILHMYTTRCPDTIVHPKIKPNYIEEIRERGFTLYIPNIYSEFYWRIHHSGSVFIPIVHMSLAFVFAKECLEKTM